jgi:hypothetical protein
LSSKRKSIDQTALLNASMTPRHDTKFGHHKARSQSLGCGLIIDEKRANGLDVPAALGLRLLRFLID